MGNQKETNENPEQLTVSAATLEMATIQPTIIETTYQVKAYGFLHKLEPKPDLTPFELWNIIRWTKIVSNNWFGSGHKICEMVWDKAGELGIQRHFNSERIEDGEI